MCFAGFMALFFFLVHRDIFKTETTVTQIQILKTVGQNSNKTLKNRRLKGWAANWETYIFFCLNYYRAIKLTCHIT